MIKNNRSFVISLLIAAILNLIQFKILNVDLTPDFILLTLIFWFFKSPASVSISLFWFIGLVVDIFMGDLLGQYALTYACCYFMVQYFMRKVILNNASQKLLYIFLIFLGAQTIMLVINVMHDLHYPGASYFLQSFTAVIIWHGLSKFKFFKLDR
jgi:rod shape-determining protein MreD